MKPSYLIITILILSILNADFACSQPEESNLCLQVVHKGSYSFSDNYVSAYINTVFFLIDVKLINKTDKPFSFVSYSCETVLSILTDNKDIMICSNKCGRNSPKSIVLEPDKTLTLPVILKTNNYNNLIDKPVRIGFVLLKTDNFPDAWKLIYQKKSKKEDIIWSNPIFLDSWGQPYEIN